MQNNNVTVLKPGNLVHAQYDLSIEGVGLLNVAFTKIKVADYFSGFGADISVTADEWDEWFKCRDPSALMMNAVLDLNDARFIFNREPYNEYRMLKSYGFGDDRLNLCINPDFLAACVAAETH